jgi:hypothetical protein
VLLSFRLISGEINDLFKILPKNQKKQAGWGKITAEEFWDKAAYQNKKVQLIIATLFSRGEYRMLTLPCKL